MTLMHQLIFCVNAKASLTLRAARRVAPGFSQPMTSMRGSRAPTCRQLERYFPGHASRPPFVQARVHLRIPHPRLEGKGDARTLSVASSSASSAGSERRDSNTSISSATAAAAAVLTAVRDPGNVSLPSAFSAQASVGLANAISAFHEARHSPEAQTTDSRASLTLANFARRQTQEATPHTIARQPQ